MILQILQIQQLIQIKLQGTEDYKKLTHLLYTITMYFYKETQFKCIINNLEKMLLLYYSNQTTFHFLKIIGNQVQTHSNLIWILSNSFQKIIHLTITFNLILLLRRVLGFKLNKT